MTNRERLLATLRYDTVDRPPDYEFGAWDETIERWYQEGLPRSFEPDIDEVHHCDSKVIHDYFETDDQDGTWLNLEVSVYPPFEYEVLEAKGDHTIFRNEHGIICEAPSGIKVGSTIPRFLRYPIESRQDWERFRDERLDPGHPGMNTRRFQPTLPG